MNIINFKKEPSENRKISISHDSRQIVFTNENENFMLTKFNEDGKEYTVQRYLSQINGYIISRITPYQNEAGFHFIGCKGYDNFIDIQTS